VPHAFARALQKAGRIVERRTEEEADIRVIPEGVDISERRIARTYRRTTIVQQLANIGAAVAHLLEPRQSDPPQSVVGLRKPGVDAGVAPDGAREQEKRAHRSRLPAGEGGGISIGGSRQNFV